MLLNYLKIAVRNIWKGKLLSAINIFGLSIGISAGLVIWMIVYYDLSFERSRTDKDRIYRIVTDLSFGDQTINTSASPYPMAAAVRNEITGIEKVAHLYTLMMDVRTGKDKEPMYEQHGLCFTNPDYFAIYKYNWLYGSAQSLSKPQQLVLTAERAATYFPGVALPDVIGRTLIYADTLFMTVSGIVESYEGRTSFNMTDFLSLATVEQHKGLQTRMAYGEWDNFNSDCTVHMLLRPGVQPAAIEKQIQLVADRHKTESSSNKYHLQNLKDYHFDNIYGIFDERPAHIPTMYRLASLALFLLLLGCINFINMQTAQATERAREIGIRKTMGSSRGSLVGQFLGESLLMSFLAGIFSLLLVPVILYVFRSFLPADLSISMLKEWQVFLFIPVLIGITGLLAGFYPAWVLSRFAPVTVLKNQVHGVRSKARIRQVLTVAQFTIALVLIMATIIVSSQTKYAFKKDLGFQKEQRLTVRTPFNAKSRSMFTDQLQAMPEVESVALGSSSPSAQSVNSQMIAAGTRDMKEPGLVEVKFIDSNYLSLYKLKLLAGRNLPGSDVAKEYIVNETFIKTAGLGTPEAALGQLVHNKDEGDYSIVGVVRDFHTKSMRQKIRPLVFRIGNVAVNNMVHVAVRDGADAKRVIAKMEQAWKVAYPGKNFKASFLEQQIMKFYDDESKLIRLLSWATGVAICISCLGLLALAIYTTRQRTKEIGIRKVLGASVTSIMALFSADVVKLVIIAIVLATPVAWYAMHSWLNDFAYHIPVPWWVFPVAGLTAITLALLTVSIQSLKAAWANPAQSLRTE